MKKKNEKQDNEIRTRKTKNRPFISILNKAYRTGVEAGFLKSLQNVTCSKSPAPCFNQYKKEYPSRITNYFVYHIYFL